MKVISKIVIVTGICSTIYIVWLLWFVLNFHGESFKDSEKYIINLSVDETINKITEYKINHPQYKQHEISTVDRVPYEFGYFTEIKYDGSANVTTSTRTPNSTWYTFSFYIEKSDAVVSCNVNLNCSPTEILLISVTFSDGFNKAINDYNKISHKENREIKKRFETEILDKIFNGKWKHKRWYN